MFGSRHFRNVMIELGSGHFGADQWWLMYDPEGFAPGNDHLPSGPIVALYVGSSGGGRPVEQDPLAGSLGRSILVVRDPQSTAYAFGKVAFGFDQVQLDCAKGRRVEARVVDCAVQALRGRDCQSCRTGERNWPGRPDGREGARAVTSLPRYAGPGSMPTPMAVSG
jgi:hypothetical protein